MIFVCRLSQGEFCRQIESTRQTLAFCKRISCSTWIDNLFVVSGSAVGAIQVLEEAESYLASVWKLSLKPSSLEYMPVWGAVDEREEIDPRWKEGHTLPVLRHKIQHTGECDSCFDSTMKSA